MHANSSTFTWYSAQATTALATLLGLAVQERATSMDYVCHCLPDLHSHQPSQGWIVDLPAALLELG